ncbi:SAM-dependent methyltransferase, partial [Reichenbachiella sp.]
MENPKVPKLTLVGAGPGDPDLITLKGIKALKAADVVLYDALANEELLDFCLPHTKKVFVGKRAGLHHYQQHVINQMIVDHAIKHGHVVRLKGGDPYVFGRGHEELE